MVYSCRWELLCRYNMQLHSRIHLEPRYRHEMTVSDNKVRIDRRHSETLRLQLLIFGGGTRTEDCGFNKLDAFDLETNEWIQQITTEPCKKVGLRVHR